MEKNVGKDISEYPPRVDDDVQAGRREPQTAPAAEKLNYNIAKRWRMDETRARMGSDTESP